MHAGQVKQIVGGTLANDDTDPTKSSSTTENFVSSKPGSYYAKLYKNHGIEGCHVIKLGLNPENDKTAIDALLAWPNHLQIGGGINIDNALEWLDQHKARQIIVTSWLYTDGNLDWNKLESISKLVGKERLVVDLSCRAVQTTGDSKKWVVAINKWQTLTKDTLNADFFAKVGKYCLELLIHAADVEGLCKGIDELLVEALGQWCPAGFEGKIVYAGGAKLVSDLATVSRLSQGKVDLTYGSALDIFGGNLVTFKEVASWKE